VYEQQGLTFSDVHDADAEMRGIQLDEPLDWVQAEPIPCHAIGLSITVISRFGGGHRQSAAHHHDPPRCANVAAR
jgi:hypothetical protein